jgi:ATP-dependent helicase/nuclease subunit A
VLASELSLVGRAPVVTWGLPAEALGEGGAFAKQTRQGIRFRDSRAVGIQDVLEKNLVVLASAGSGKTYTLTDRIIGLMARGVEPEKIVALTFTRKAAGEFADAMLHKLADAAEKPATAAALEKIIGAGDTDFGELLEKVIRKLPKLTLSTMDSFFSRIVRGFQYELGLVGGRFELLEGEAAEEMKDEILENMLDGAATNPLEEEVFIELFRRATADKEEIQVIKDLRDFINAWHDHYGKKQAIEWGPASMTDAEHGKWEKDKDRLIELARRDWPNVVQTHKAQQKAFETLMDCFAAHRIGSGSMDNAGTLFGKVVAAMGESSSGKLELSHYKEFSITGMAAQALRELVTLAAHCEFAAALSRTRGVYAVVSAYDALVERELRSKAMLGFQDVKRLMGEWMSGEDARLRREAVDFRLDSRHQHWLLDEFQDTSREEWNALLPLVEEAISDDESTVFVVGDKKQAIYAWRGGDVGLFDEILDQYGEGLQLATMAESWRSCPQILELVNQVFGDAKQIEELFGKAAERWKWEDHRSAAPLTKPEKAGYTRVDVLDTDDKSGRLLEILTELGIGKKQLSCGVLVPTNTHVKRIADELRAEGFQVVEEGSRSPSSDHPVGIMIWQLLRWIANPADHFAQQSIMMSPLGAELEKRFDKDWSKNWEILSAEISENGFAGMVEDLIAPLQNSWGKYGQNRASDLLEALRKLDRKNVISPRKVADSIGRMKISQSPGIAAVQVMTFHKSKGLGFDVVILPEIPKAKIPDLGYYEIASGEGWMSQAPAKWARAVIPQLREAERIWSESQAYESFCKLYVAMTRAKRGLYLLLDTPAKDHDESKASFTNWLMSSLHLDAEAQPYFEIGAANWANEIPTLKSPEIIQNTSLGQAIPKRNRTSPSDSKPDQEAILSSSRDGRAHGIAIHAAFEKIGWLDEDETPVFPPLSSDLMPPILATPAIQELLSRKGKSIQLYREQRIEAVLDGEWMSGVIDRLHVHLDENEVAYLVEIIDFKTDRISSGNDMLTRYEKQLRAYSAAVQLIYPGATVKSILVSPHLHAVF